MRAFVPEWVAPNLLTFVGFLHALAAYALLLAHSPALDGSAPSWVYVACAVCLFVYQTMDGMDGKQARRVGAGSPLGEVVDHGADAIASCVYGVFLVDVFGIGWESAYAPSLGRWPAVCLITYSRAAFALDSVAAAFTGRLPVARLDAQRRGRGRAAGRGRAGPRAGYPSKIWPDRRRRERNTRGRAPWRVGERAVAGPAAALHGGAHILRQHRDGVRERRERCYAHGPA